MRIVKHIVSAFIVLLCFLLSSELYQAHLQSFTNQFFFFQISNNDREYMCSVVLEAADKYGEDVFAVERTDLDAYHSQLKVYGTKGALDHLAQTQSIASGTKSSLFSGSTAISLHRFNEIVNNDVERFYFTGTKDSVSLIRQYVYSKMAASYIHKESAIGNEWIIYAVWAVSLLFLLLLTWMDIQFQRKSNFLRMSLGQSVHQIILKNVLLDVLLNSAVFLIVYFTLSSFVFADFEISYVCFCFLGYLPVNSSLYFSLLKCDYKQIIYGANINEKTLANTYILKACVMILLIVSLSCNLSLVKENLYYLLRYDTVDRLDGYQTMEVKTTKEVAESEDRQDDVYAQIFFEKYRQGKVLIAASCATFDDEPIVVINENAADIVVSNPEIFQESERDFVVYIPTARKTELDSEDIDFAARSTASHFFGMEASEISYDVVTYEHTEAIYFDVREVTKLTLGFDVLENPIIVYCNISPEKAMHLLQTGRSATLTNVMFALDGTEDFLQIDGVKDIACSDIVELCNQFKGTLLRIVLLNSTVSLFLLILSILIISAIAKLEYMINAKMIAIKKILGYSLLARNKVIVLLNLFAIMIGAITGFILSGMYEISTFRMVAFVSFVILIFDSSLIMFNILKMEKRNVSHILKGGSL